MPTQAELQSWLQASPVVKPFQAPQTPDLSYIPPEIRQEAGYDVSKLQAAGVSPSRAMQLMNLRDTALKRAEQQRFETDEKRWVNEAGSFDVNSPTYQQDRLNWFKQNPEAIKSQVVNGMFQQADAVASKLEQDKARALAKDEITQNRIESKNASIEQAMGRASFTQPEVDFFKNEEGVITPQQQGAIIKGIENRQAEIEQGKMLKNLDSEITGEAAIFDDPEASVSLKSAARNRIIAAQQKAGITPDSIRLPIPTEAGTLFATKTQIDQAKSYKPTIDEKKQWLESNGIDPEKLTDSEAKRAWSKAYNGVQDARLNYIVNEKQTSKQEDPYGDKAGKLPTVNSPEEASKLPSGTIFLDSNEKRRRVP